MYFVFCTFGIFYVFCEFSFFSKSLSELGVFCLASICLVLHYTVSLVYEQINDDDNDNITYNNRVFFWLTVYLCVTCIHRVPKKNGTAL